MVEERQPEQKAEQMQNYHSGKPRIEDKVKVTKWLVGVECRKSTSDEATKKYFTRPIRKLGT